MQIRIHHFFDIIRDFGRGRVIDPHKYQHSYHTIAQKINEQPDMDLTLVIRSDAVCVGCIHLKNSNCDDTISHRKDFLGKEDFNNYLDKRIMETCGIEISALYSPKELCENAHEYLGKIEFIYEGNDPEHTDTRKENVFRGFQYYSQKHNLGIEFEF